MPLNPDTQFVTYGGSLARVRERHVAIELKTSGFSTEKHRITEIAMVEVLDKITGIADWAESIQFIITGTEFHREFDGESDFSASTEMITDFIGNSMLIGHNLDSKLLFLHAEYKRCDKKLDYGDLYCTLQMSHFNWGVGASELSELCRRLEINPLPRDIESADCLTRARLIAQCRDKLCTKNAKFYFK